MKMKFSKIKNRLSKIIAIFVMLLLIAGYSCMEELRDSPGDGNDSNAIEQAKKWYEANKPEETVFRSSDGKIKIAVKPEWKNAFSKKNGKYEAVETELMSWGMYSFTIPECMEKFVETEDIRYRQSYSRIVFLTDRKTNETVGFLMTQVPSLEYLEKSNFKPFKTANYLHRDNNFGGWILFHNLDGSFSNGWIYEKGKITGAIKYMDSNPVEFSLRATVCYQIDWYLTYWDCPYWYTGGEDGYSTYCTKAGSYYVGTTSYCEDDGNGSGNYNGGSGGSGPGNPNPPNDPCSTGTAGNTNNNNTIANSAVNTGMHDVLKTKAASSTNEWAVSIGKSSGSFFLSAPEEGWATGGYIPNPPAGTDFVASGHSHAMDSYGNGSSGVPSPGDLYRFLQQVSSNYSMQTMYVYGTGYYVVNNTTVQVPETYAINLYDRSAVLAFLSAYPASSNLINGENGWVTGTYLKGIYDEAKNNYYSSSNDTFSADAAAMSYIMSFFNMGVTLSRKVDNNPFKVVNAKNTTSSGLTIYVTTCN